MNAAVATLNADSELALVCRLLKSDLQDRLNAEILAGQRILIERYHMWADKYHITFQALESHRDYLALQLNTFLKELGYE